MNEQDEELTGPEYVDLFGSDLAIELRSIFYENAPDRATGAVLDRFGGVVSDPNDGPVVIICLAILQLERGVLTSVFRDAAIDLIESGEAQHAWKSDQSSIRNDRATLLTHLADELRAADVAS